MSNYEERMSKKYNFFSNEKDETDTNVNEPDAINETSLNIESDEENMMVPISAWKKVLDQLGNLHEADKLMAEARERACLLYTSPSPRDATLSRMPSSA